MVVVALVVVLLVVVVVMVVVVRTEVLVLYTNEVAEQLCREGQGGLCLHITVYLGN